MNLYYEVDKYFTLKIHKEFIDIDDYYKKCSSCYDIDKLQINTLFINSKDDLISPIECINFTHFESNEKVMMLLTEVGGHVTFYHGHLVPKRWFIQKSIEYVEIIHSISKK
jgi:predicted alpha/beta-fold hydrolase